MAVVGTGKPGGSAIVGTGGVAAVDPPPRRFFHTPQMGKTIGIVAPSYGLEHLTYSMDVPGFSFRQLTPLTARRLFPGQGFWLFTTLILGSGTSLLHLFNHLPVNKPFVVSFEMELPRNLGRKSPWQDRFSFRQLMSDRCRRILPMSDAARNFFLRRASAAGFGELESKTEIFRGAVSLPPSERPRAESGPGAPIKLLFVGGEGLRKGLTAAVSAVEQLNAAGIETHLTAVSRVTEQTYAVPGHHFPGSDLASRIQNSPHIRQILRAPNQAVRAMMLEHDALVLPSVDESLGWVVIEAGLSGLPVIASDMFAIPELIQHHVSGWLLPMELDEDRRWLHLAKPTARDQWDKLQDSFASGIVSAVEEMAGDSTLSLRYGAAAKAALEPLYAPDQAALRLKTIYEAAL